MEAFNIKFVGEVEKYPELYDYTRRDYSKRDVTEKAWSNVAKEVNLEVNECKEKWRNLRSTFVKNLKPKRSGTGGTKKKPYYLMDAMQFAVPFVKVAGNPTGNLPETSETLPPLSTPAPDVFDTMEEAHQELTEETMFNEPPIIESPAPSTPLIPTPLTSGSEGSRAEESATRGPHGHPIRKRKHAQPDTAEKAFVAYLSAKQARLSNPPPPTAPLDKREEGIKNFVLSLVPDLMQLTDVQLRTFKRKTLDLLDEISAESSGANRGMLPPPSQGIPVEQSAENSLEELLIFWVPSCSKDAYRLDEIDPVCGKQTRESHGSPRTSDKRFVSPTSSVDPCAEGLTVNEWLDVRCSGWS